MNNESEEFKDAGSTKTEFYRYENGTFQGIDFGHDQGFANPTLEDAAVAIAAVLHLYEKPTEDLHGYTDYLEEARAFLLSREITANPDNGPDFERTYDDTPVRRDPLAALGIE